MTTSDEPVLHAIAEAEIILFGQRLRCYVLEDHSRVINAEDMAAFFDTFGDGEVIDQAEAEKELLKFQELMRGKR